MEMKVVVDKWLHTLLTAALLSVNQLHDVVHFPLRSLSSDVAELSGAKRIGVKTLDVPYRKNFISY